MRLGHRGGGTVHLSCGTNVQPVPDLPTLIAQLDAYATGVNARCGVDTLGLSLWLPPALAAALAVDTRGRARLRTELHARGLEVVTLSGLPYADGGTRESPPEPDWSTDERLEYTLDLARILVDLLPDDAVRGSVVTTGIGRRADWDSTRERAGARILGRLSSGLAEIAWQTGRAVRVGLQPGPGAVLDSVEQTIAALARVDKDRVGISLDLAALACTWQEPTEALDRLAAAGISIIRVQVAAAIEATDPAAAVTALRGYAEEPAPYPLATATGGYVADLATALSLAEAPEVPGSAEVAGSGAGGGSGVVAGFGGSAPSGPWRICCPLPLSYPPPAPLAATTAVSRAALRHLLAGDTTACEHLDVRPRIRGPRPSGDHPVDPGAPGAPIEIATELAYVCAQLQGLGLSPKGTCAAR